MSRALPGGMLNSKEKTEYEDWLEDLHKDIDKNKSEKDCCPMPLMDSECGANGCHNYDGSLMTDENKVHGIFESVYSETESQKLEESQDSTKFFEAVFNESHLTEMNIGNVEKYYILVNGRPLEGSKVNYRHSSIKPKGGYGATLNMIAFDTVDAANAKIESLKKKYPNNKYKVFSQNDPIYDTLIKNAKSKSEY